MSKYSVFLGTPSQPGRLAMAGVLTRFTARDIVNGFNKKGMAAYYVKSNGVKS
jgi:hypothetical protein